MQHQFFKGMLQMVNKFSWVKIKLFNSNYFTYRQNEEVELDDF